MMKKLTGKVSNHFCHDFNTSNHFAHRNKLLFDNPLANHVLCKLNFFPSMSSVLPCASPHTRLNPTSGFLNKIIRYEKSFQMMHLMLKDTDRPSVDPELNIIAITIHGIRGRLFI